MEEFVFYINRIVQCEEREVLRIMAEKKDDAKEIAKKAALLGTEFLDITAETEFELVYETLSPVLNQNGEAIVSIVDPVTNVCFFTNR